MKNKTVEFKLELSTKDLWQLTQYAKKVDKTIEEVVHNILEERIKLEDL